MPGAHTMSRPYPTLIGLDDWITREPEYEDLDDDACPGCGCIQCECDDDFRDDDEEEQF